MRERETIVNRWKIVKKEYRDLILFLFITFVIPFVSMVAQTMISMTSFASFSMGYKQLRQQYQR